MGESSKCIEDLYAHLDLGSHDGVDMDFSDVPAEESQQEPQWCLVGKLLISWLSEILCFQFGIQ